MQNYNFLVLSPVKKPKLTDGNEDQPLVAEENRKFAIKHTAPAVINMNDPNKKPTVIKISDVDQTKQEFVLSIMVSSRKKICRMI
jgi:hypothetical protein